MSFAEYLVNSLVGILVVFFALILLMIIIKIITAITDKQEKKTATAVVETPVVAEDKPVVYAKGTAGDLNLYDTDPRDAAMIMAIVADETNTPLNELRFISIREVVE